MQGMTLCIERLHLPAIQFIPLFVVRNVATRCIDRLNVAVHRARLLNAVNGLGALDQFRRINHVRRASWMHYAASVGQCLHQKARTARMVKMDVCEENKIDVGNIKVMLVQRVDEQRNAIVGAGIDKRGPAALNDQMAGILQRSGVFRVDSSDAVIELRRLGVVASQALLRLGRFEAVEAREIFGQQRNIFLGNQRCLCAHNRVFASTVAVAVQGPQEVVLVLPG